MDSVFHPFPPARLGNIREFPSVVIERKAAIIVGKSLRVAARQYKAGRKETHIISFSCGI